MLVAIAAREIAVEERYSMPTILSIALAGSGFLLMSMRSSPTLGIAPANGRPSIDWVDDTSDALSKVQQAWARRQDIVRSATFEWSERKVWAAGTIHHPQFGPEDVDERAGSLPATDVVTERVAQLWLSDGRIKYSLKGPMWDHLSKSFVVQEYVSSYDGETSVSYWPPHVKPGEATYFTEKANVDANQYALLPLLTALRGEVDSISPVHLKDFSYTGDEAIVEGRRCWSVERVRGNRKTSIYVDPSLDYCLAAYESSVGDHVIMRLRIKCERTQETVVVPISWTAVWQFPDGKMKESVEARVRKYKVNVPIEVREFRLALPSGTHVRDNRNRIEYLLKQDGDKRLIAPSERALSHERLMGTDTGMATAPESSWWPWIVGVNVCILAIIASWSAYRWRRRRGNDLPTR